MGRARGYRGSFGLARMTCGTMIHAGSFALRSGFAARSAIDRSRGSVEVLASSRSRPPCHVTSRADRVAHRARSRAQGAEVLTGEAWHGVCALRRPATPLATSDGRQRRKTLMTERTSLAPKNRMFRVATSLMVVATGCGDDDTSSSSASGHGGMAGTGGAGTGATTTTTSSGGAGGQGPLGTSKLQPLGQQIVSWAVDA